MRLKNLPGTEPEVTNSSVASNNDDHEDTNTSPSTSNGHTANGSHFSTIWTPYSLGPIINGHTNGSEGHPSNGFGPTHSGFSGNSLSTFPAPGGCHIQAQTQNLPLQLAQSAQAVSLNHSSVQAPAPILSHASTQAVNLSHASTQATPAPTLAGTLNHASTQAAYLSHASTQAPGPTVSTKLALAQAMSQTLAANLSLASTQALGFAQATNLTYAQANLTDITTQALGPSGTGNLTLVHTLGQVEADLTHASTQAPSPPLATNLAFAQIPEQAFVAKWTPSLTMAPSAFHTTNLTHASTQTRSPSQATNLALAQIPEQAFVAKWTQALTKASSISHTINLTHASTQTLSPPQATDLDCIQATLTPASIPAQVTGRGRRLSPKLNHAFIHLPSPSQTTDLAFSQARAYARGQPLPTKQVHASTQAPGPVPPLASTPTYTHSSAWIPIMHAKLNPGFIPEFSTQTPASALDPAPTPAQALAPALAPVPALPPIPAPAPIPVPVPVRAPSPIQAPGPLPAFVPVSTSPIAPIISPPPLHAPSPVLIPGAVPSSVFATETPGLGHTTPSSWSPGLAPTSAWPSIPHPPRAKASALTSVPFQSGATDAPPEASKTATARPSTSSSLETAGNLAAASESQTNLIINYLPQNMTQEEFHNLFASIGEIRSYKLVRDKKTGQSLGYGFINYKNPKDAEKAVHHLDGFRCPPKTIKVSYARPNTPSFRDTNLYVSGLPKTMTQEELEELFSTFGSIIASRILINKISGASRGVGFIRFNTNTEAEEAIKALNGKKLHGFPETLSVRLAFPQVLKTPLSLPNCGSQQQSLLGLDSMVSMTHETQQFCSTFSENTTNKMGSNLPGHTDNGWCIFVYNLGPDSDENTLWQLFGPFGAVNDVKVIRDFNTNKCKRFGFVTMTSRNEASLAVASLNGYCLQGRVLQVSFKTNKIYKA